MRFRMGLMAVPKTTLVSENLLGATSFAGTQEDDAGQSGINMGMLFVVSGAVTEVTGIRYWKTTSQGGAGSVSLWLMGISGAANTEVATKSFSGHTGTGWKQVDFDTPYTPSSTRGYMAHWWQQAASSHVYYGVTNGVFDNDVVSSHSFITGVKNDGLTHANLFTKGNGWTLYGNKAFPSSAAGGLNYSLWVDVAVKGAV